LEEFANLEPQTPRPTAIDPLSRLGYFAEWGGRAWETKLRAALDFIGPDLSGKRVLELGPRHGRVSSLLALLGASVTCLDVQDVRSEVMLEAGLWGVQERVEVMTYEGDPDVVENDTFDVVFTKSVLVLIADLVPFLETLSKKVKPGGKFAFIENVQGGPAVRLLRAAARPLQAVLTPGRDLTEVITYFTPDRIAAISRVLEVRKVEASRFPPIYLVCAVRPR
jgi:SAM-dependent methyltransferase